MEVNKESREEGTTGERRRRGRARRGAADCMNRVHSSFVVPRGGSKGFTVFRPGVGLGERTR